MTNPQPYVPQNISSKAKKLIPRRSAEFVSSGSKSSVEKSVNTERKSKKKSGGSEKRKKVVSKVQPKEKLCEHNLDSDSDFSDLDVDFEEGDEDRVDSDEFVSEKVLANSGSVGENTSVKVSSGEVNRLLTGVESLEVEMQDEVEDDSDELRSLRGSGDEEDIYPIYNPDIDYNRKIDLQVGLKFPSLESLRLAIQKHAVENGYGYFFSHNESRRVSAYCEKRCKCTWNAKKTKMQSLSACKCLPDVVKCHFRLYATRVKQEYTFQIKSMNLKHNCGFRDENKKASSEFLARKYMEWWRTNSSWRLKEFQEQVYKDIMVKINKSKACRVRARAKLQLYGNGVDEYARVWDYAEVIKKYNPGSSAYVVCETIDMPITYFQRIYICLQACKEGFVKGCKPIVGVDGCHLKDVFPGMCLVAVGKDGNNNIFPVAWAVVEVENGETWRWFLDLLLNDIGENNDDGEGLTFMSDRQKGLLDALSSVVPKSEIRYCVRHIWANFKLKWSGQGYKESFWKAARATSKAEFDGHLDAIKLVSPEAFAYLAAIPPCHWSRHAFSTTSKSNMLLNNMCETFNSVLKEARDKPILTHMEWMRRYVMKRNCDKRQRGEQHKGKNMPYVDKYFIWAREESRYCVLTPSRDNEYEVDHKGDTHIVNLIAKTCSCFHWNLSGLPCPHAFACILNRRLQPEDFVSEFYSKSRYMMTYGPSISPMPGPKQWEKSGNIEPSPPQFRKLPGRPSLRKRKKEVGEGVAERKNPFVKRVRKANKCSNCGELGHYKSTCVTKAVIPVEQQNQRGRPKSSNPWAVEGREKIARRKAVITARQTGSLTSQPGTQQSQVSGGSGPQTQGSQANVSVESRRKLQFTTPSDC